VIPLLERDLATFPTINSPVIGPAQVAILVLVIDKSPDIREHAYRRAGS
jgi:hypothetical protein